jgi:hypothetical protein
LLVSIPLRAQDTWTEQRTMPDDAAPGGQFGSAASLNGDLALIGADGGTGARGAAYFFGKSNGTWSQVQKITPDDPGSGDEFGYRVKLTDDAAIVTSFSATVGANTAQGAAYVFANGGGTWTQAQKLTADDGVAFDNFGASIGFDGATLVIGANGSDFAHGAAYVFTNGGGTWMQAQKLTADDGAMNDNFGISAVVLGTTMFVGAHAAAVDSNPAQGAVYVFEYDGSTWNQVQKLTETSGAAFDYFGISLAFDGTTLLIGATGSGGRGAVYAYANDGSGWSEQQRITVDDLVSFADFGNAIALHGGDVLIGADVQTIDGFTSRGTAYLFHSDGGTWSLGHQFISSDGTTDDFFGLATDYDGTTALITTLHPNQNEGAAYFYTNADDTLFADGFDG